MVIQANNEHYQQNKANLLDRIRKKECCIFIGAGLSKPANYPLWPELLETLKIEAGNYSHIKVDDENLDNYERAELYKNILGINNLRNIIQREFDPNNNKQPWLPVHLELVEMPFVSYFTTNYDCLTENAFKKFGVAPVNNYYPLFPMTHLRDRHIYHIHGIVDYEKLAETHDSIILTKSDFDEAYAPGSSLIQLISRLYMELTIFFIGFNVSDPFMMRILKNCLLEFEKTREVAFQRGRSQIRNIKHYALLPYPKQPPTIDEVGRRIQTDEIDIDATSREDQELESMGVYTIRYIGDSRNHTPLINIIHEMYLNITGIKEPLTTQDLTFLGE